MKNGASDTLFNASQLADEEVFSLLHQQLAEELLPLVGEEAIEQCVKDEQEALEIAEKLYPDVPAMLATRNGRVRAIARALETCDYKQLAI